MGPATLMRQKILRGDGGAANVRFWHNESQIT
jgi:hypothetical protein